MSTVKTAAQAAVQAVLDDFVARGEEQGLQVAAYHNGELVVDAWAGIADPARGRPYDGDTLVTIFSCTKGVASTAVHLLAERGEIDYKKPVAKYWPEFGVHGKDEVTVAQALSHQAGIPQVPEGIGPADLADWERVCAAVAALEPLWEPGKGVGYHSLTHGWITGPLIERVSGRPVADFIREELFAPLGVENDFYLGIPDEVEERIAPLEMSEALLNAEPPKPGSFAAKAVPPAFYPLGQSFNRPDVRRAVVPGAGGIANARALAKLYAALIGEVDGVRLLPDERVKAMTALQTDAWDMVIEDAFPKAIGYFLGDVDSPMGMRLTAFGHSGYGGTIAFADPEYGFAFALLKNRLKNNDVEPRVALEAARAARQALGIPEVDDPQASDG